MKYLNKIKPAIKLTIYIVIIAIIQTMINLIINISNTTNQLISVILLSIYIFITNISIGKKVNDKAYLIGLKNGAITILTLLVLSIITFNFTINSKTILFYLIIIFVSILGCIIGINKKR